MARSMLSAGAAAAWSDGPAEANDRPVSAINVLQNLCGSCSSRSTVTQAWCRVHEVEERRTLDEGHEAADRCGFVRAHRDQGRTPVTPVMPVRN